MPLQFGTRVELTLTGATEVRLFSALPDESIAVPLRVAARRFDATRQPHWSDYVRGVLAILQERGPIAGADVVVDSDIPASGLSSSASFTVALMSAFVAANEIALSGLELARACQRVEHDYVGVRCGLMDQAVAVLGTAQAALAFDTATGDARQVRFPEPHPAIVVIDSGKSRQLATSHYNARRADCERAAALLGVAAARLALVSPEAVDAAHLDPQAQRRARHVTMEHRRVLAAVQAITARDWAELGRLFTESHESLRTLFEVSCDELDELVDAAMHCEGVEGARLTGAGFGGAVIALVRQDAVERTIEVVQRRFAMRYDTTPKAFVAEALGGATELT